MLTDERIEKLVSHGVDFRISIDGAHEKTLHRIRGVKLAPLVRKIETINETRSKQKKPKTRITFNFAICYSNVYELTDLIELGSKVGLDELCVIHLMPQVESQRYQSLFYHMDTFNRVAEQAKVLAKMKKIKLDIPPAFNCGRMTSVESFKKEEKRGGITGHRGSDRLYDGPPHLLQIRERWNHVVLVQCVRWEISINSASVKSGMANGIGD